MNSLSKKISKDKIWKYIEYQDDLYGKIFNYFIGLLIFFNLLALTFETDENIRSKFYFEFQIFNYFCIIIFTIEYLLRIFACKSDSRFSGEFGRIKYFFSKFALIDLIAILPFYIEILFSTFFFDTRILRTLRLLRVFLLMKGFRYSNSLQRLARVFRKKSGELYSSIIVLVALLFLTSSLMYYAENEAQPEKFGSIIDAMWWAVAALTTVGYGDVTPITPTGKIIGSLSAIMGIGLFAVPAGILASGFSSDNEQ